MDIEGSKEKVLQISNLKQLWIFLKKQPIFKNYFYLAIIIEILNTDSILFLKYSKLILYKFF
jgi:hypothetical protein